MKITPKKAYKRILAVAVAGLLTFGSVISYNQAVTNAAPQSMTFPVIGSSSYTNDYNGDRFNGKHRATDIFAKKHQKIVSATDGTIEYVTYPEPSWGNAVIVRGNDGYCYWYLHINNDKPGTDNGKGGAMNAFAQDMKVGNPIKKGQHIGYVGDSGNAETTPPHLHFSVHKLPNSSARCATEGEHDNPPVNPYGYLNKAKYISKPVSYPELPIEKLPFAANIPVNVAVGNLDSNANDQESLVGAGFGGNPRVKVIKQNKTVITDFHAYLLEHQGGVDVAIGDVTGDAKKEIITVPGKTGTPRVKVFSQTGQVLGDFYAGDKTNRNGLRVAAGDIDGDGKDEIVTSPESGANAEVKIYKMDGTIIGKFMPYSAPFAGGVDVAVGDVNNDGVNEIITSTGIGSNPTVRIHDKTGRKLGGYTVYHSSHTGGVRVSVGEVRSTNPGREIIVSPQSKGTPRIKVYNASGKVLIDKYFIEQWWQGSYDADGEGSTLKATVGGNRRASLRNI